MTQNSAQSSRLREDIVKKSLEDVDWPALKAHLDAIAFTADALTELCGHIQRFSDWIAKYPRKSFEKKRDTFWDELEAYARQHLGSAASDKVTAVRELFKLIEHGYRSILAALAKCDIGKQTPEIRASACISRACYQYHDFSQRTLRALQKAKRFEVSAGIDVRDDDGNLVSMDDVSEGLATSVNATLIMEALKNDWFDGDIVVLPSLPGVNETERYQSGATQAMALFWRHWQRLERRRRYLEGEIRTFRGGQRPPGTPAAIEAVIQYVPEKGGLSEREVYDYLANERLKDRLIQTFMEMNVETRISDRSLGIDMPASLPPDALISPEELHGGTSLSEILGYPIVNDTERPAGLRLVEWVRGYAVLKELARKCADNADATGDNLLPVFTEDELLQVLERCGLERAAAARFMKLTSLHRSSRDMFDCPLVRLAGGKVAMFAPAVISVDIAMVVLSNLSNRSEELGRKGKAFEEHIREVFKRNNIDVFAFKVKRDGETYEYDAVAVWGDYIFVFECKNRSLSGNDPGQAYYFDLEVRGQAKQASRLADALVRHPDIIEKEIGPGHVDKQVVAAVLHSLPYSRAEPIDGVYFTDASALTRFLEQRYFFIKAPHRIGQHTLLHRTALKNFWKGDKPTPDELLQALDEPFALTLLLKHLTIKPFTFAVSETELVAVTELSREPMTTKSACEAVGADPEIALQEISDVYKQAKKLRRRMEKRGKSAGKRGKNTR
jgi:hypothetical protein